MLMRYVLLILISIHICSNISLADGEHVKRAIGNINTDDYYYINLKVVDENSGEAFDTCVIGPKLFEAVSLEKGIIDETYPNYPTARKIAAKKKDLVFKFKNKNAIELLRPRFDKAILEEVANQIKGYSNAELIRQLKFDVNEEVRDIYAKKDRKDYNKYLEALACLLIKRGLFPKRGGYANILSLESEDHKK